MRPQSFQSCLFIKLYLSVALSNKYKPFVIFITEEKVARFSIMFGNLIVPPSFPLSNVDKPV